MSLQIVPRLWSWISLLLRAVGLIRKQEAQERGAVTKQKGEIDAIASHPDPAGVVADRMRDGTF